MEEHKRNYSGMGGLQQVMMESIQRKMAEQNTPVVVIDPESDYHSGENTKETAR